MFTARDEQMPFRQFGDKDTAFSPYTQQPLSTAPQKSICLGTEKVDSKKSKK